MMNGLDCGERGRMADALRFGSRGIVTLRRFASRHQARLARRLRSRDPPARIRLGRSNEILKTLLQGEKVP
jgi:hypothetical protein